MAPSRNHEVPLAALAAYEGGVRALLAIAAPRLAASVVAAEATASVFSEEDVRLLLPDGVWLVRDARGRVVRVVVVEVQRRWRREKALQWAIVHGLLQRRFRCPVELVVMSGARQVRRNLAAGVAEHHGLSVRVRLVSARALLEASDEASDARTRLFLLVAGLRIAQDELGANELEERIRRERGRVGIEGMPEPLRDAFLACLHRLRPPHFEELKELVMLTMEMLSDGTLIASPEGRRLLKKFGKLKVKEGREEGREEGRLLGKREALRASLSRRFGELSAEALAMLEAACDEARVDAAHEGFADGLPLARILERLQNAPSE
jgi:hypothetical protein